MTKKGSIVFYLGSRSGVAPYLQLVHQVKHALRLGFLQPGDQLPTMREVVAKLVINPNTVFKAYRMLEHEDFVASRPGQGTFVSQTYIEVSTKDYHMFRILSVTLCSNSVKQEEGNAGYGIRKLTSKQSRARSKQPDPSKPNHSTEARCRASPPRPAPPAMPI